MMAGTSKTKTRMTKTQAQKLLSDVPQDKVFWSHDGQVFKSLYELERGLNTMADEAYSYHANSEKNDFSIWIRQVIGDEILANDIEKTLNRQNAAMKVEERIHHLISK
jgi:hypothetical protein